VSRTIHGTVRLLLNSSPALILAINMGEVRAHLVHALERMNVQRVVAEDADTVVSVEGQVRASNRLIFSLIGILFIRFLTDRSVNFARRKPMMRKD